ncbi:Zinc finger, BED-type predicted domain containing protein [Dorcoceras hygrometricum]|uniref:Zinc finger, BED-type predicted domain containing protein n=1 Tax=Dorcoceras hygrometricum TaxID=472368 RepID=A0A2Z7C6U8_9LAMI|nr:Zinc finger, BED-type predicted domain containing protein [Dorcoceras hygrometricum]
MSLVCEKNKEFESFIVSISDTRIHSHLFVNESRNMFTVPVQARRRKTHVYVVSHTAAAVVHLWSLGVLTAAGCGIGSVHAVVRSNLLVEPSEVEEGETSVSGALFIVNVQEQRGIAPPVCIVPSFYFRCAPLKGASFLEIKQLVLSRRKSDSPEKQAAGISVAPVQSRSQTSSDADERPMTQLAAARTGGQDTKCKITFAPSDSESTMSLIKMITDGKETAESTLRDTISQVETKKSTMVVSSTVSGGGFVFPPVEIREINWTTHFLPKIDPSTKGTEVLSLIDRLNPVEEHCLLLIQDIKDNMDPKIHLFNEWSKFHTGFRMNKITSMTLVKQMAKIEDSLFPWAETEKASEMAVLPITFPEKSTDHANSMDITHGVSWQEFKSQLAQLTFSKSAEQHLLSKIMPEGALVVSDPDSHCGEHISSKIPQVDGAAMAPVVERSAPVEEQPAPVDAHEAQIGVGNHSSPSNSRSHQYISSEMTSLRSQVAEVVDCHKELRNAKKWEGELFRYSKQAFRSGDHISLEHFSMERIRSLRAYKSSSELKIDQFGKSAQTEAA